MSDAERQPLPNDPESTFRLMADSAPALIWLSDAEGRITFVNRRYETMFGGPSEEAYGDKWRRLLHPDDAEGFIRTFQAALEARAPYAAEVRVRDKADRWVWLRCEGAPRFALDGDFVGYTGCNVDITEAKEAEAAGAVRERDRREAEAAAVESERRLRALADNLPLGMVYQMRMRRDGSERRFVYVSEGCERLNGVSAEAAMADSGALYGLILPEFVEGLAAREAAAIARLEPMDAEVRMRRPNGESFWSRIVSAPRALSGDELIWDGLQIDVTAQHEEESARRGAEERARLATESADIGTWDWDLVGGDLRWDDRCRAVFGLPPGAPVDYAVFQSGVHPDDLPPTEAAIAAALEPEGAGAYDVEYRTIGLEDGVERWIAAKGRRVFQHDRSVRFIGTVVDITERKQAALRNEERERRLNAILDGIGDGFFSIDRDWRFTSFNRVAEQVFGRSRSEAIGYPVAAIFPDGELSPVAGAARRVLETGEVVETHSESLVVPGRWFERRVFPLPDGVGIGFRDVTARREAEEALAEEKRTLETLNRTGALLAGELDLKSLVQAATDAGVALTGADMGAFFYNLVDEAGESYTLYTLSGAEESAFAGFGLPRATAVFHPTFHNEGVIRSDDILTDPRYGLSPPHHGLPAGHLPVRSYLAASVVARSGEVLGGLFFSHAEPGRFGDRHERMVIGLAAQAAVAIDNARLYQAAQAEIGERRRAQDHLQLLIHELNHRVKNTLATVQSIAGQTLRRASTPDAARQALTDRLIALSRAHDVLTAENWEGANLHEVVLGAIEPFRSEAQHRFLISGPSVRLTPKSALALAMAFHELGTNAAKYGALSTDAGRVDISWAGQTGPAGFEIRLTWRERGGPPVTPPKEGGFGSRLIARGLAGELNGEASIDYAPEGVVCTIVAPLSER